MTATPVASASEMRLNYLPQKDPQCVFDIVVSFNINGTSPPYLRDNDMAYRHSFSLTLTQVEAKNWFLRIHPVYPFRVRNDPLNYPVIAWVH